MLAALRRPDHARERHAVTSKVKHRGGERRHAKNAQNIAHGVGGRKQRSKLTDRLDLLLPERAVLITSASYDRCANSIAYLQKVGPKHFSMRAVPGGTIVMRTG